MSGARIRAAGLTIAALLLSGCGGTSGSHNSSSTRASQTVASGARTTVTSTSTGSSSATHRHRQRRRPVATVKGPRVGTRQAVRVDGAELTVTILRVVDLTAARSSVPRSAMLPGTRPVGVELRIANQSGPTYDSTSSGDVSLVLSRGESEPLQIRAGVCETPLVDFESFLSAGSVRSGCVAFSVPRSARVIGVRFSPHSRAPGTLTWRAG